MVPISLARSSSNSRALLRLGKGGASERLNGDRLLVRFGGCREVADDAADDCPERSASEEIAEDNEMSLLAARRCP